MRINAKQVRELFNYDPLSGALTRKVRTAQRVQCGDAVGWPNTFGHLVVCVKYKKYLVHCLIWLLVTGKWPKNELDHRDTNPANNRWVNLREATKSQNMMNRGAQSNNRIGLKGVSWHATMKKYRARIFVGGKEIPLGYFGTPKEAHAAYIEAAKQYYGEFARAA